jgi:hypothetical protein
VPLDEFSVPGQTSESVLERLGLVLTCPEGRLEALKPTSKHHRIITQSRAIMSFLTISHAGKHLTIMLNWWIRQWLEDALDRGEPRSSAAVGVTVH